MKAKKDELKLKTELDQMKREIGSVNVTGGGLNIPGSYNFSAQDITAVSNMSDPEKQKFLDTLQKINMMSSMSQRGGAQGMNPMLQFMAMGGFNKQGEGLGLKDILELQKTWQTIYQGAGQGKQGLTDSLLLKLITDTVPGLQNQANTNLQMAYNAQIEHLRANQSDPMRDIKFIKEMGQELGLKPSNASESVALKTLEMENLWKQKDWEFRMMEHRDRRNLGIIDQILTNAKGLFKDASRENIREFLSPQQQPHIPPAEIQVQNQQAFTGKAPMDSQSVMSPMEKLDVASLKYYACQGCGINVAAPAGITRLLCPSCGTVNNVTG